MRRQEPSCSGERAAPCASALRARVSHARGWVFSVYQEGHTIGNNGYSASSASAMTASGIRADLFA